METLIAGNAGLSALATRPASDRSIATLSSEDFFKILVTELQSQDPLEPSKTSDMIGQVSQIRSIELSAKMGNTLDKLVQQQRTAGMTDLLGKFVTAVTNGPDGAPIATEGVGTGVTFTSDGSAVLELDTGYAVRIQDVVRVSTLEQHEQMETLDAAADELIEPAAPDKQEAQARSRRTPDKPSLFNFDWRLRL